MEEVIRAERQIVSFFDGLEIDGYRMPNGEFRVGLAGASRVLGYNENWLADVLMKSARTARALQGLGFSLKIEKVLESIGGNDLKDRTISLEDFNRLIVYATSQGKKAALALQLSLTQVALNDFFRDAFDELPLTIWQKKELFYQTYAKSISPADWRIMDREDILKLALLGDELHLKKGRWNQY